MLLITWTGYRQLPSIPGAGGTGERERGGGDTEHHKLPCVFRWYSISGKYPVVTVQIKAEIEVCDLGIKAPDLTAVKIRRLRFFVTCGNTFKPNEEEVKSRQKLEYGPSYQNILR